MNVRQLMSEVKQRRPLWDRSHNLRHERSLIDALWEEVAIVLGHSAKSVKGKWKTLKDTYRKEAKKTLNDPNYQSPWANYQALSFLYGQLGIDNSDDSSNSIADQEKIEFVYENMNLPLENGDNATTSARGTKRKNGETNAEIVGEIWPKNEGYLEDEDMCFFKSLVPHIKQLSPQKKMLMRIKIQEMVYREVYSDDFK